MKKVVRNWYVLLLLAFLGWAGAFYYLLRKEEPVVKAPFEKVTVPYETFELIGDEGGEFISQKGTKIVIPAKAFIDKAGDEVSEKILIKYRQIDNAPDIFLSGLPMNYDSVGERLLETADVLEIKAFVRNKQVFIAKNKRIELKYTSSKPLTSDFGVFYFDSLAKKWQDFNGFTTEKLTTFEVGNERYVSNAKRRKEDFFLFDLEIDKEDYPELQEFKDLKWAYIGSNDHMDPRKNSWAFKILWTKTKLTLVNKKERIYQLVLSNNEGRSFKTLITPFREELLHGQQQFVALKEKSGRNSSSLEAKSFKYKLEIDKTGAWNIARKRLTEEEQVFLSTLKFSDPSSRSSSNEIYLLDLEHNTVKKVPEKTAQKIGIKPSSNLIVLSIDDDNQLSFDQISDLKKIPSAGLLEFYLMQCDEAVKSYNHFHKLLTM